VIGGDNVFCSRIEISHELGAKAAEFPAGNLQQGPHDDVELIERGLERWILSAISFRKNEFDSSTLRGFCSRVIRVRFHEFDRSVRVRETQLERGQRAAYQHFPFMQAIDGADDRVFQCAGNPMESIACGFQLPHDPAKPNASLVVFSRSRRSASSSGSGRIRRRSAAGRSCILASGVRRFRFGDARHT
jgi:hypothetical protein